MILQRRRRRILFLLLFEDELGGVGVVDPANAAVSPLVLFPSSFLPSVVVAIIIDALDADGDKGGGV